MSQQPRLYALLVGIDRYPAPVPALGGCKQDVRRMAEFLEKELTGFKVELQTLTDEAATKNAVIEAFRRHLGQARQEDAALFFYAGHGTQEDADPECWRFESDRKLETLVTYDGIVEKDGATHYNLLADKELRFLLHELARSGAHILTLFDCCHSGGNTRNAYLAKEAPTLKERRYRTARLSQNCPARPWEQFLFAGQIDPARLKTQPLAEVMPTGRHVQIAACQSDQSAFEKEEGGVFTQHLLQVLRATGGELTYYDLQSRIRHAIRHRFDQTPQVYAADRGRNDLFLGFLGRPVSRSRLRGNVIYHETKGWVLDLGAIHGIGAESEVKVRSLDGRDFGTALIQKVASDHSILSATDFLTGLPAGLTAQVAGTLLQRPLAVCLQGDPQGTEAIRSALPADETSLTFTDQESGTDFLLIAEKGAFHITFPGAPDQPLTKTVAGYHREGAGLVISYLQHIAQWQFIKELHNPNAFLFADHPVHFEIFRVGAGGALTPLPLDGDLTHTDYEKGADGNWSGSIRIRLTNQYERRLYVSLSFLSLNFMIYPHMLDEPTVQLEPGEATWAFEGGDIELDLPPQVTAYGWPYSPAYFKLIAATQPFDISRFEQPDLPAPDAADATMVRGIRVTRREPGHDWTTRLVTLRVRNPEL